MRRGGWPSSRSPEVPVAKVEQQQGRRVRERDFLWMCHGVGGYLPTPNAHLVQCLSTSSVYRLSAVAFACHLLWTMPSHILDWWQQFTCSSKIDHGSSLCFCCHPHCTVHLMKCKCASHPSVAVFDNTHTLIQVLSPQKELSDLTWSNIQVCWRRGGGCKHGENLAPKLFFNSGRGSCCRDPDGDRILLRDRHSCAHWDPKKSTQCATHSDTPSCHVRLWDAITEQPGPCRLSG